MTQKRAAAIELGSFLVLVFSFIWIWARAFPHASLVVYLVGLGITFTTHLIHRETPWDLGLRFDNLMAAAKDAAVPTVPLVTTFVLIGLVRGHPYTDAIELERFVRGLAWGFLQQYLLQAFIHRRVAVLLERPVHRELTVALIFGALHLPNPILAPVTALAGYIFAVLYRRHPNLVVLSLCHAIGSMAVVFGLGPESLHKMRVGPGYFRA